MTDSSEPCASIFKKSIAEISAMSSSRRVDTGDFLHNVSPLAEFGKVAQHMFVGAQQTTHARRAAYPEYSILTVADHIGEIAFVIALSGIKTSRACHRRT